MKDKVEIIKGKPGQPLLVLINDLVHLSICCDVQAIHSYIDEKSDGADKWKLYYIEFYLDNSVVNAVYNDRELWETILKGL